MIGQQLGFDHGDRLDRLVLCDCRPDAGEAFLAMWDGRIDAVKAGGMASIVDSTLERWFTQGFRTGEPELMAEIAGIIAATRVEGYLGCVAAVQGRSEEHTSELQSLMRISYAVFCLKKQKCNTQFATSQILS